MKELDSGSAGVGSTVWGAHHMPQNRDVAMIASGDGSLSLWKYQYPDQRRVKVRELRQSSIVCGLCQGQCLPVFITDEREKVNHLQWH